MRRERETRRDVRGDIVRCEDVVQRDDHRTAQSMKVWDYFEEKLCLSDERFCKTVVDMQRQ